MSGNANEQKKLTPKQVKAARELLGITAAKLAEIAGVPFISLRRFEKGKTIREETLSKIIAALHDEGISFINRGDVIGVKLSSRK